MNEAIRQSMAQNDSIQNRLNDPQRQMIEEELDNQIRNVEREQQIESLRTNRDNIEEEKKVEPKSADLANENFDPTAVAASLMKGNNVNLSLKSQRNVAANTYGLTQNSAGLE